MASKGRKRRPSFFKIMINDFSAKLCIPPAFIKNFGGKVPNKCFLWNKGWEYWKVDIKKIENNFFFEKGWKEFAEDNSLKFGDLLLFDYEIGKSTFDVKLYGADACEKDIVKGNKKNVNVKEGEKVVEKISKRSRVNASFDEVKQPKKKSRQEAGKRDNAAFPAGPVVNDGLKIPKVEEEDDAWIDISIQSFPRTDRSIGTSVPSPSSSMPLPSQPSERIHISKSCVGMSVPSPSVPPPLPSERIHTSRSPVGMSTTSQSAPPPPQPSERTRTSKSHVSTSAPSSASPPSLPGGRIRTSKSPVGTSAPSQSAPPPSQPSERIHTRTSPVGTSAPSRSAPPAIQPSERIRTSRSRNGKKVITLDMRPGEFKKAALKRSRVYKPVNPYFKIVMHPSYVLQFKYANVPKRFADKFLSDRKGELVLRQSSSGQNWHVNYISYGTGTGCKLSVGWKEFMLANQLQVGDVCVCELIERTPQVLLEVVIVRNTVLIKSEQ